MAETQVLSASRYEALRQYNEIESPSAAADIEAETKQRDRMFAVPAELVQAPFVTICSVWPERLISQAFTHGGVGVRRYTIEAGSPEKPAYLLLQNTFDLIITQEGVGQVGHSERVILASQYGADIIKYWTGDHVANRVGKKGVGMVIGERTHDPNNPIRATKAEIAELVRLQDAFLMHAIERADYNWDNGKQEKATTRENRKALDMLGLDQAQHKWYRSKRQLYQNCPRCAETIQIEATWCKHCSCDLAKYFMDRDIVPNEDQWPGVVKEISRITQGKAKKA